MSIIIKIIIGIILLGIILFIHELGHFLAAKASGVEVLEFALGMGPKLISREKNGTVYSLRAFPFGGFCAMKGEDEEDHSEGSFQSASVWRRIMIVAAGPVFNLVLGLIGAVIIIGTCGVDKPYVTYVSEGSAAEEAGLQQGDLIVKYNGSSIANSREIYLMNQLDGIPVDEISLTVLRDGEKIYIAYPPQTVTKYRIGYYYDPTSETAQITDITFNSAAYNAGLQAGDVIVEVDGTEITTSASLEDYWEANPMSSETVKIGIIRDGNKYYVDVTPEYATTSALDFSYTFARERTGVLSTIGYSFAEVKYWIHSTYKSLFSLVTGKVALKEMSGPIGIVEFVGDVYEEAAAYGAFDVFIELLNMMVLLTVNLGVINLLPLPALDGGRLLFLIIEAIRRKPLSQEIEGKVHYVGIIVLMGFLVLVTVSDVVKLF